MITPNDINRILQISENYQLHGALQRILFDKKKREDIFCQFLEIEQDLSYDWFTDYFQRKQADRKELKQDYTPDCICKILSGMCDNSKDVLDVCAGIGGLTISFWEGHKESTFYAEELSGNSVALLLFNFSIRGINGYIRHGDVLENKFSTVYKLTNTGRFSDIEIIEQNLEYQVDAVISNPPYSLKFEDIGKHDKDARFAAYGLPPKSKADYAFVLHGLSHLKENGSAFYILPHGVLFRGGGEEKIRRQLIENNLLDAVIGLPEKLFLNTQIPVCILVLKKNRADQDVLVIDASKKYKRNGKQNNMDHDQIAHLLNIYKMRRVEAKYSERVTYEKLAENGFNLNIPRYIDNFEEKEPIDIGKAIEELIDIENEIHKTELQLSGMLKDLKGNSEYEASKENLIGQIGENSVHACSNMCKDVNGFINLNAAELMRRKKVILFDVADFERSKKNKVYKAGCTLIQISATSGQMHFMDKDGCVDSKYGVIQPREITPKYLYYILDMVIHGFLARYQTGLNINPEIFGYLEFEIHKSKEMQEVIAYLMDTMQAEIDLCRQDTEIWRTVKEYHLDNMFA